MEVMKQKWGSGIIVGLLLTVLVVAGCSKGSHDTSTSVSTPSAAAFKPTGTIQGIVTDAVTQEPIVNALVSIGVGTDVTNAQGQYVIANVPATTDALNDTVNGEYDITIDLRSVTSPVKMTSSSTTPRYPDFSYSNVEVNFTSLNDSSPCPDGADNVNNGSLQNCGTNNTNHDTPVNNLVANQDMSIGKLDANISGTVFGGCEDDSSSDFYTLKPGYVVNLLSKGSENSSTGNEGHIVATVTTGDGTTNPAGQFTFTNVEANTDFEIQVMDSATNTVFEADKSVTSPTDGATDTSFLEASNAIHVCPVNSDGPTITSVGFEPGSDLAPSATETVTFTFNSPVDTTQPQASTDPSNQVGLVFTGNLEVDWDGNKDFVPSTAAWNAAGDQLTVTFATAASSLYEVYLDVDGLKDTTGRPAAIGTCPDAGSVPSPWNGGSSGVCDVYFSTNGGPTPGTPVLTLVNAAGLDEAGATTGIFDWPVVSGAKTYNLYCSNDEIISAGTVEAGSVHLVDSGLTDSEDTVDFSGFLDHDVDSSKSSQVGIQYPCYVTGVNSDGVEGPASNTQTAADVLGPELQAGTFAAFDDDADGNADTVRVRFDEALDEASAETTTNYTFADDTGTAPTVTNAYLCTGGGVPVTRCLAPTAGEYYVVLTFATQTQTVAGLQDNAGDTLTVSGVKDVNLNTIRSAGDVYHMSTGAVN